MTYYARIGFQVTKVTPVVRERAKRYVNLRERRDDGPLPVNTSLLALGVPPPK